MTFSKLKVALVTDWLTNLGGGEKVLASISELFPDAPIFTTVVNKDKIGDLAKKNLHTSYLQKIPFLNKKHQLLLPLLPIAIESLDLSEYDLILSFSSAVAKSVLTTSDQIHICYIHSPMRYAWEPFFDTRFHKIPKILMPMVNCLLHKLRLWDKNTSSRPDLYIANSLTTQSRVNKYYRLETKILYPPVNLDDFKLSAIKGDYYLGLGRMVTYKKFDLLVNTFKNLPDKQLILAGDGPERKMLEKIAQNSPNIKFLGEVEQSKLVQLLSKAKAFLLPQKEDAGIVQLEALASGTPVIAFKAGGALEVINEQNGIFFLEQTPESLKNAILEFEKHTWKAEEIRESVEKFDIKNFQKKYLEIIRLKISQ